MDLKKFLPKLLINILFSNKEFVSKPFFLKGTTVFADISGFTQLSEALSGMGREGSEVLTKILNLYFDGIISIIYKNNGDIMRFAGDAVTAFFPDKKEALDASQKIISFMKKNEICKTPQGDFSIKIKIGISSGIHTLFVCGLDNLDYVFAGEPVDRAAEAEHCAKAGEIVILPKLLDKNEKIDSIFVQKSKEDIEKNKILKKFLNPVLLQKISANYQELLNEHRKAVVLFLSFKGIKNYYNFDELKILNEFYMINMRVF